ncbi:MAG TPA: hypothetical protein VMT38_10135 [Terracidiphilus sp.]|nr:hypothetical protein [Terracidiphilus sp.]
MTPRLTLLLVLLLPAAGIRAQTDGPSQKPPKLQLYGGYAFLSNSFNGLPGARHPLNGWNASFGLQAWRFIRFKVDVSQYLGTNTGASQNSLFIAAGAQFYKRIGRETIFAEGLMAPNSGDLTRDWGPNHTPGETASFAGILGGGVDTPVSRRVAIRVEGDYQYTNFQLLNNAQELVPVRTPGIPNNFARITSGLVWSF